MLVTSLFHGLNHFRLGNMSSDQSFEKPPDRQSATSINSEGRPWIYQSFKMPATEHQDAAGAKENFRPPPPYPKPEDLRLLQLPQASQANPSRQDGILNPNTPEYPFEQHQAFPDPEQKRMEERLMYSISQDSQPFLEDDESGPSTLPQHDESILSQALEFTSHIAPAPPHISPLSRPIAIPQLTHGRGQSFLRAWPPCLQSSDISKPEFLAFIDNLNIVSIASPPLQVLDLAGGLIGMVPYHWAQIAGTAIQAAAKLGVAAVSKSRTDIYMKEVNERMFKPRGLRVSITSMEAMRGLLRVPSKQPVLAPVTAEAIQISTLDRVLLALAPFNAVLDLNVPPPAVQTTMLARLSARQVVRQANRTQKKSVLDREKTLEKATKREMKDEEKAKKKERKWEKKHRKKERKHGRTSVSSDSDSSESDGTQLEASSRQKEKKTKVGREEKNTKKVLWIVIDNMESR